MKVKNKLERAFTKKLKDIKEKIMDSEIIILKKKINQKTAHQTKRKKREKKEQMQEINSNISLSDISDWPFPVPDNLTGDLIKRGSEAFQKKDGPFVLFKETRE
ncbi:hypothetical protein CEXT_320391 [Caerostris extrusa]|uniref:Uncharacterized protein n=1 Tax=Caerostris extrusa TaxID=172846 RepID=A0AAV4RI36_CAEEX|nr:hypothetical protein CEXT_320391 [Caerostris extrusa]